MVNDLVGRWNKNDIFNTLSALRAGAMPASPFGNTEAGLIDLRGMPIAEPVVVKNAHFAELDFSHSAIHKLLFMQCRLTACAFRSSKIQLLSNGSVFEHVDFSSSDLTQLGCTAETVFTGCSFSSAKINAGNLNEGTFNNCSFLDAKTRNVEFGKSVFNTCLFQSTFMKCFFRGEFNHCNFLGSNFIDCAFYGVTLADCTLPDRVLLFKNWSAMYPYLCGQHEQVNLSQEAQDSLTKLCDVWSNLAGVIRDEIIDYKSLARMAKEPVASELFAYFEAIHRRIARPDEHERSLIQ